MAHLMQVVHAPYAMQWQVFPAPEPREIVWRNLATPVYQRMLRQFLVYSAVFMTVLFYMIPIALISSLTTLSNLVKILPFIKVIVNYGPINTVLQVSLLRSYSHQADYWFWCTVNMCHLDIFSLHPLLVGCETCK